MNKRSKPVLLTSINAKETCVLLYEPSIPHHYSLHCFLFQYFPKSGPDIKLLGEMIFGSVAMTVRGSTLKVHIGGSSEDKPDSLPTVMLTKVALPPLRGKRNHLSEYASNNWSKIDSAVTMFSYKRFILQEFYRGLLWELI